MEIKGYNTQSGYFGYVDAQYMFFSCESDYLEYMADILLESREKN